MLANQAEQFMFAAVLFGADAMDVAEAELAMVPKNILHLEGKSASAMVRLIDFLEEHDDVQSVYSNYEGDGEE